MWNGGDTCRQFHWLCACAACGVRRVDGMAKSARERHRERGRHLNGFLLIYFIFPERIVTELNLNEFFVRFFSRMNGSRLL